MNTLRHTSLFTRNGIFHNIRKLWLLLIMFSFMAVNSGCNESGLPNTALGLEVVSTSPAANAFSVPVDTSISVTFNEAINSNSIHEDTFILQIDTVSISGTFSSSDLTAVFTPSAPLDYGGTYSVLINSDIESLSGTHLAENYEWSFSTEEGTINDIPQVISTNPANNADDVLPNSAIMASFNKPMNASSLNTSTFTVFQGSTPISGMVSSANSTATFSPFSVLDKGSTYHAVISSEAKDTLGNSLQNNFEWSFTTAGDGESINTPPKVQSVSPPDDARDIPVGVVISASFNKDLDNASVNSSTFLVTQNGNSVSGSISLSDSVVSFTPDADLQHGAVVTTVITTGVTDENGSSLSDDYEWSFVIMNEPEDTRPPHIWSVTPHDEERDVPVDIVISAGFSKLLDNSSVNESTFLVYQNGNSVSGSVSLSDSTISFTPNTALQYGADIFAVVTSGVKDQAGNNLPHNYEWTFVTMDEPDNTAPKVISISPAANARDVDVDADIMATFSEPVNESTVNNSTIIVTREGRTVSGSVNYSDNTVRFTPNNDLREKKTYMVTITTGVEDLAGNRLERDVVWTFRTEKDDDDDDD